MGGQKLLREYKAYLKDLKGRDAEEREEEENQADQRLLDKERPHEL